MRIRLRKLRSPLPPRSLFFFLLVFATLSACSPALRRDQPIRSSWLPIPNGSSLGQSFVPAYDGLQAVHLAIDPPPNSQGVIRLVLADSPAMGKILARAELPFQSSGRPTEIALTFEPLPASARRDLYFEASFSGPARLQFAAAPGDAYLDGSAYLDQAPQDAQLSFSLEYNRFLLLAGLAGEALSWGGLLLAAAALFSLPGLALLDLAGLLPKSTIATAPPAPSAGGQSARPRQGSLFAFADPPLDWIEALCLSLGAGFTLIPPLMLWTDVFNLHLGAPYAWLSVGLGFAWLGWRSWRWLQSRTKRMAIRCSLPPQPAAVTRLPILAFILVAALVIAVRLWVIRRLDIPLWGDSYQHTLIAQLLVENGGLFDSWLPYAPLTTFTYHFGFHAIAATLQWLTALDMPRAVLVAGQLVNAAAVLGLYPLARRAGDTPWAGVGAVLIAGLLTSMPMAYINWGRYTQLAGQAVLPVLFSLVLQIYAAPRPRLPAWTVAALAFSGLGLIHYRVLIFAILFIPPALLFNLNSHNWKRLVAATAVIGLLGGFLFLPYFLHAFQGKILSIFAAQISTPAAQVSRFIQDYNAIAPLQSYLPMWLWLLQPFALLWSLLRRQSFPLLIFAWWLLVLVAANPGWLGLPGAGAISNFAVFIFAYFPAALLAANLSASLIRYGLPKLGEKFVAPLYRFSPAACFILVLAAAVAGIRPRLHDLRLQEYALVTRPDQRAAAWIRAQLPPDAVFLVNSFSAYDNSVIVGSDGGWWLPLLAGRQTNLPPLNYGSELGPDPGYRLRVNDLWRQVMEKGLDDPQTAASLQAAGITHVYVGQRQGMVNNPAPLLAPEKLLASPHLRPVYRQDRVWIFELIPPGSPAGSIGLSPKLAP